MHKNSNPKNDQIFKALGIMKTFSLLNFRYNLIYNGSETFF